MKTLVIAHNYTEDSFAAMSYHLAHYLAESGFRIIFISHKPHFPSKKIYEVNNGKITVYSWPTQQRPTKFRDFLWFAHIYTKYRPDFVIGHFVGSNIVLMVSKIFSLGRTKTIDYYHTLSSQIYLDSDKTDFKQNLLHFRKKIFYKLFCDVIICPSALSKIDLEKSYSVFKGKVILNPMTDRFTKKVRKLSDKIVVSYLGRLDKSKGVLDLVNAFNSYTNIATNSEIQLNIAGAGSEKEYLLNIIENNPNIRYVGHLPYKSIDEFIQQSDFIIIPSKHDNLTTVGIESLMNTVPLLISNMTGLADYLNDGIDCFKFDPDIESIREIFKRVETDIDLQCEMSINARKTYEKFFNLSAYYQKITQLL